jgi:hypothetical protein
MNEFFGIRYRIYARNIKKTLCLRKQTVILTVLKNIYSNIPGQSVEMTLSL